MSVSESARPSEGVSTPSAPSTSPPPTSGAGRGGAYRLAATVLHLAPCLVPLALIVVIVFSLVGQITPSPIALGNLFGPEWNPDASFGVQIMIVGTFVTALPALLIAMLIALGVGIASSVYLPRGVSRGLDPFVDLLAGIPSIVLGLWAFIVVGPYFASTLYPWMTTNLAFIPGFGGTFPSSGQGIPLAIFVLTLMILPISTVFVRDTLRSVPRDLWESGLALGATRWEVTRRISLRYGSRGISSAALLGFSRAVGEAIAVSIVLGANTSFFPTNIYSTSDTLAALIVQELDYGLVDPSLLAALAEVALILTAITLAVNLVGRHLVRRVNLAAIGGGA